MTIMIKLIYQTNFKSWIVSSGLLHHQVWIFANHVDKNSMKKLFKNHNTRSLYFEKKIKSFKKLIVNYILY